MVHVRRGMRRDQVQPLPQHLRGLLRPLSYTLAIDDLSKSINVSPPAIRIGSNRPLSHAEANKLRA
jgi:hypothetical protein